MMKQDLKVETNSSQGKMNCANFKDNIQMVNAHKIRSELVLKVTLLNRMKGVRLDLNFKSLTFLFKVVITGIGWEKQ